MKVADDALTIFEKGRPGRCRARGGKRLPPGDLARHNTIPIIHFRLPP